MVSKSLEAPSSDGAPNKNHFDKYANLVNLENLVIQQIETLMNLSFDKFLFIYEWVSGTLDPRKS